jgi:hypothetical protein
MITPLLVEIKNSFTRGYACALVILLKYDGTDTAIAREMFNAQLGSIENCRRCGVDENDLKELEKYFSSKFVCDNCAEVFKSEIDLEAHLFNNKYCNP